MLSGKQWRAFSQEYRIPCLLADIESGEILYINSEMQRLLPRRPRIVGEKFYDVIRNDSAITSLDFRKTWTVGDVFEHKIFDMELCRGFVLTHMYVHWNGGDYHFIKYQPTEQIDFNFEDTISQCISIVQGYESEKIPSLLKILGEFYVSEKAYLYQVDYETGAVPCVDYWRKHEGIVVVPNLSQKFPTEDLLEWFKTRNEVGIVEASAEHTGLESGSIEEEVLTHLNLKNIVMSVIENEKGEPLAIVAVSNRENIMADFRLLQAVTGFLEKDISSQESDIAMQQMSSMDILTGFYTRVTYGKKLDRLQYQPPKKLGVVFANVNGLKKINTEFGLARGDSYIQNAAKMIQQYFNVDFYRISGDEFVAFFPNIEKKDFENQVRTLLDRMKQEKNTMLSIGYCWKEGHFNVADMVAEADTVMYINKQDYYHSTMNKLQDFTNTALNDVLTALKNGEFEVYLQPQILLEDNSLYGAEALVRRRNKDTGVLQYPEQFISKYERKSVIRHVDIFVIERVCDILSQWVKQGKEYPISVNLSRITLQEHGIADIIAKICDQKGVPRHLLVIEVTERIQAVENNVPSTYVTDNFKNKGFKLSLDDFGCAYSNIVTLSQIEVDEVKIDKSLVDFLATNEKNRVLVKNMLTMCDELEKTSTLAEGVEDQEQADLLKSLGCMLGQGYFYSEPISVEDFEEKYNI